MLSATSRTAGAAFSYHFHLEKDVQKSHSHEDYYAVEGKGQWRGIGADKFGLSGEVAAKDFATLSYGFDPRTGAKLVQNAGGKDRVAGFDLTFSAPKSVSVSWAIADDKTASIIEAAHDHAVAKGLDFIQEKAAFSRIGHGGEMQVKADLAVAVFRHGTSRELDPQIHSHAFVLNAVHREDGTTGTLDARHFYEWQKAGGAIYRAELASELKNAGYAIERDGDSFRLANVTRAQETEFSTRRQQIEAALKANGQSGAKASEIAALSTRKPKELRAPDQLRREWMEQGRQVGLAQENAQPGHCPPMQPPSPELPVKPSPQSVLRDSTEMKSVVRESEIYRVAAVATQGNGGADAAKFLAESAKAIAVRLVKEDAHEKIVSERFTSQEILAMERQTVDIAHARQNESHRLKPESIRHAAQQFEQAKGFSLSDEQHHAVEHVTGNGGVKVLIGDAGSGKSTTLDAARVAFQKEGWQVIGAAPTGKAAAGLAEGAGIESTTIHKLLHDHAQGYLAINAKTVIVLDEAGMIGTRQMNQVQRLAKKEGAKLILVGDTKQLQPVAAGAPLKDISDTVGYARLEEIHRQRDDWARQAAQEMSRGEAATAMLKYIDEGKVRIVGSYREAVNAVAVQHMVHRDRHGPVQSISIAATNRQVNDLNHAIREQLKHRGELQHGEQVRTRHGKTEIAQGERVVLEKNDHRLHVKNGDFATVKDVSREAMTLTLDRTQHEVKIDLKDYGYIRHGYAATVHKSQGIGIEGVSAMPGKDMSREMSYVTASRARDETQWIFTREQVKDLLNKTSPTERMIELAETIEEQRLNRAEKPALPETYQTAFREIRDYLNAYAYQVRERDAGVIDDPRLAELKDVLRVMSQSRQNESTLDYRLARWPQPEKVASQKDRDGPSLEK